jgi:hypothetical protein
LSYCNIEARQKRPVPARAYTTNCVTPAEYREFQDWREWREWKRRNAR